jgi:hypothetical protein
MLVRCAYYHGTVAPENRKTFDDYVLNVHLPDVASWPRLLCLRLLKNNGEPYLDEAPRYYQCFELSFDSQQDMDFCMASQARVATRKQAAEDIARFKGLFIGEVHHVNYEVTDIPITQSS